MGQPQLQWQAHSARGDPKAKEARIIARQCVFHAGVTRKVLMRDLAKLRLAHARRCPAHCGHGIYAGVAEALKQHSAANHPSCTKDKNLHRAHSIDTTVPTSG